MPWESVGCVDTGEMPGDESWIRLAYRIAQKYVEFVCGQPPEGCKLGIMENEHELGSYPSLGIWYEYLVPSDYIRHCERTFEVFEESIDWYRLKIHYYEMLDEEEDEQ